MQNVTTTKCFLLSDEQGSDIFAIACYTSEIASEQYRQEMADGSTADPDEFSEISGTLYDHRTGKELRDATPAEFAASITESISCRGNSEGVILVAGIYCFVS